MEIIFSKAFSHETYSIIVAFFSKADFSSKQKGDGWLERTFFHPCQQLQEEATFYFSKPHHTVIFLVVCFFSHKCTHSSLAFFLSDSKTNRNNFQQCLTIRMKLEIKNLKFLSIVYVLRL